MCNLYLILLYILIHKHYSKHSDFGSPETAGSDTKTEVGMRKIISLNILKEYLKKPYEMVFFFLIGI